MEHGRGTGKPAGRVSRPGRASPRELVAITPPPVIHRALDLPPDRLAPIIGSWPEPALLESGPGFGEAGRWSILTARPRKVFEATGKDSTSCLLHTGEVTRGLGRGFVLEYLTVLLDDCGLADPSDTPDPD